VVKAPEILSNVGYNAKVDLWSLGVILYILLCGFPPFYEENTDDLFEQIKQGRYEFPSPWWDSISDEAKDLVRSLLVVDPSKRFTVDELLAHQWITHEQPTIHLSQAQSALVKYNAQRKMRKAAMGIIAAQKLSL